LSNFLKPGFKFFKILRSGIPATIEITATTLIKKDNKYFEITLVDNGIGFESQHAENIFNTFTG